MQTRTVFALLCAIMPVMALAGEDIQSSITDQDQNVSPTPERPPRKARKQINTEAEDIPALEIKLATGFRHDKLDWNIAAPGGHPDVLSELKFDMNMKTELSLSGTLNIGDGFVIKGEFSHARAYGGEVRDSDYLADHRTLEFSRSYSKLKGSAASHYSLGTGWRFGPFTPLIGYAWIDQNLRVRNGEQVIDIDIETKGYPPGYPGPILGLDTRYKPFWQGPWVGAQITLAGQNFDLQLTAKHQWFRYRAEADWNLRDEFAHPVSFRHTGDSTGWQLGAEAIWKCAKHHAITLGVDWSKQRLKNGTDRTFFSDGTTEAITLNEVNAKSLGATLGYRFSF